MDSMEARRNAITELINERGNITFADLKEAFPRVSDMTLRTDLKLLDEAGRIIRIHGGAKSIRNLLGTDDYFSRRAKRHISEKQLIAEKAVSLITAGSCIYLDSGTTTTALAKLLNDENYNIYTTGLNCAMELSRLEKPTVTIPGGSLNRYSMSVYGAETIRELEYVFFDQAFMGVTCYSPETGFTCAAKEEAMLKQKAISHAAQKIVLMDSSKVGKRNNFLIGRLEDIDILISDGKLDEAFLEECRRCNVLVL